MLQMFLGEERYLKPSIVRKGFIKPERKGKLLQAGGRTQAKAWKLDWAELLDKTAVTDTFELQTWGMFGFLSTCPFPKGFTFVCEKKNLKKKTTKAVKRL